MGFSVDRLPWSARANGSSAENFHGFSADRPPFAQLLRWRETKLFARKTRDGGCDDRLKINCALN